MIKPTKIQEELGNYCVGLDKVGLNNTDFKKLLNIFQSVCLCGSETWVVMGGVMGVLGWMNIRVKNRITRGVLTFNMEEVTWSH